MNRKQIHQLKRLVFGFFMASSIAVFAAVKFPYVGQWGKNVKYADGSAHQILLTFAENGSCSYAVTGLKFPSKTDCPYRMQGTSAILTLKLNAVIKGIKYRSIVIDKGSPQTKGREMSIQPLELRYMKDGKWTTKKARSKPVILSRLK